MDVLQDIFKAAEVVGKVFIKIFDECPDDEIKDFLVSLVSDERSSI